MGSSLRGLLAAADAVREDARSTVQALQARGLRVLLISGAAPMC